MVFNVLLSLGTLASLLLDFSLQFINKLVEITNLLILVLQLLLKCLCVLLLLFTVALLELGLQHINLSDNFL